MSGRRPGFRAGNACWTISGRALLMAALGVSLLLGYEAGGYSAAHGGSEPVDLVVVPETDDWLLPVAVPPAARLRQSDRCPLLMVVRSPATEGERTLLRRLSPRKCLVLAAEMSPASLKEWSEIRTDVFLTGTCPTSASLAHICL